MSVRQSSKSPHPPRGRTSQGLGTGEISCGKDVLELLPPGSFATLDNQPSDLPPFQVIECRGGRCLIRQQAWGRHVQWEVEHQRLHSA